MPDETMTRRLIWRQYLFDGAIALASWVVLVLPLGNESVLSVTLASGEVPAPWAGILASTLVVPLLWRRTHPVPAASAYVLLSLLQFGLGLTLMPVNLTALIMLYSLAAFAPRWAGMTGLVFGLSGALMMAIRTTSNAGRLGTDTTLVAMFGGTLVGISWLLGRATRQRRFTLEQMRERAERLEREQLQERALAQADERASIAREMHDIIAHSLSVIIAQADGARYAAPNNPQLAIDTLELVSEQGRTALDEMRRLLGVLRTGEISETAPTPGLEALSVPVAAATAAGIPVEVDWHGTAKGSLPAGAELVAYRVVQEALTNTIKHAGPGARARVELRWQANGLEIDVRDDGRGAASSIMTRPEPSGQGLRGMRERVSLYGGNFAAGPSSGGGFRVRADLPYEDRR